MQPGLGARVGDLVAEAGAAVQVVAVKRGDVVDVPMVGVVEDNAGSVPVAAGEEGGGGGWIGGCGAGGKDGGSDVDQAAERGGNAAWNWLLIFELWCPCSLAGIEVKA